jgi:D-alanyl-lipoteichoic acid acyltransferase DltB (MBOAT superfamily)
VFLFAASLGFYACADPAGVPFLFAVCLLAWRGGISVAHKRSLARLWAWIVLIVAPLLYYKFHDVILHLSGSATMPQAPGWSLVASRALQPLGISFFTFQAIAYVVDVHRKEIVAERSLLRVGLFLSFFPLVLAGPIERAGHLFPQLDTLAYSWKTRSDLMKGVFLILKGMLLKLVFADNFAVFVNEIYSKLHEQPPANAVFACYLYAGQIYCDFYGYTLIALGSAALFGIDLINNFEHPYLSANVIDFWRRWHISLSNWLRDYIFFSLGGVRKPWRLYGNTMITMLLCGLWHGAGLGFLLWGCLHGAALIFNRLYNSLVARRLPSMGRTARASGVLLGTILTFHFVTAAWVPFRAESLSSAGTMFDKVCLWLRAPSLPTHPYLMFYTRLAICFLLFELSDYFLDFGKLFHRAPPAIKAILMVAWYCSLYFAPLSGMKFVYFGF